MMSKLNTEGFVNWTLQAIMSTETLRMVYFAYLRVHSIMSYGIIFWGNRPYSEKIFKLEKGWSELSQIQESETHVGNYFKDWKYYPYTHNIFSLYQYLW
jgi:hypothetical protein